MKANRIKRLFLGCFLTLLIAQVLYGALMLSALYDQFQRPLLQVNGLLCKDLSDHLGLLLRVGKSLRPSTIERSIKPYYNDGNVSELAVTEADGSIIYQRGANTRRILTVPNEAAEVFGPVKRFNASGNIWLTCPVLDKKGATVNHVFIGVNKERVFKLALGSSKDLFLLFFLITAAEILLLAFLLKLGKKRNSSVFDTPSPKVSKGFFLRACIVLPLILGQLAFLLLLISPLQKLYQSETIQLGQQSSHQIVCDLERLVYMGMSVEEIGNMDSWLTNRQQFLDSRGIAVYDAEGNIHSAADRKGALSPEQWSELSKSETVVTYEINHIRTGDRAGMVSIAMDASAASRSLFTVMLDNLTLTIVATLFLIEISYLLLMGGNGLHAMASKAEFMRPVIFGCLFGTEIAMSYVPIRIGELGLELFGLPPDVVSGLPISCELFMAGTAMLIGGAWSQRRGWRPMLITGIVFACAGSLVSWLANGPLPFILSRGIAGFGYGFINLSAQVFVIAHSPTNQRARNLAFMFAGLYAGSLCGSALGGLVADRLGYAAVFPASAMLLLLLTVLLVRTMPHKTWTPELSTERFDLSEALRFVSDRRMGSLLLFFIIPNALITVCLFQFFVPLSLSQSGTSPASIGRVFLVYCLIVMFAGPVFGTIIDRSKKMHLPLFLSLVLAAVSVLLLLVCDGLLGALCSMAVLAVSTGISSNGQGAYALSLPAAERFGKSRTMGIYNVAMRAGQVLGPLCLGVMMAVWDTQTALIILTTGTLACAALFFVFSRRGDNTETAGNA